LSGVVARALTRGLVIVALTTLGGCAASSQLIPSQPSAVTQQLLVRSLERALMKLDVSRFAGRKVSVELTSQSYGAQAFAMEFVTMWLEARGVRVTSESPDLTVKVIASVLGTDRGETFFGIPQLQSTLIGVPTPEVSLFKWVRNRGLTEMSFFVFDARTNTYLETVGPGIGRSKQDDVTILIVINFTTTDVEDRPPPPGRQ
jgi:hypothetical protein